MSEALGILHKMGCTHKRVAFRRLLAHSLSLSVSGPVVLIDRMAGTQLEYKNNRRQRGAYETPATLGYPGRGVGKALARAAPPRC